MTERPTIYWRASLLCTWLAARLRLLAYRADAAEMQMLRAHIRAVQRRYKLRRIAPL